MQKSTWLVKMQAAGSLIAFKKVEGFLAGRPRSCHFQLAIQTGSLRAKDSSTDVTVDVFCTWLENSPDLAYMYAHTHEHAYFCIKEVYPGT